MKTKHLVFFGEITFFDLHQDGEFKAVISRIDTIKLITEDDAEVLISANAFNAYVIPELYKGKIIYNDDLWHCTDASCNQWRQDIDGEDGSIFFFREDRIINPETKEIEPYEATIDLDDYTWFEKVDACEAFGYSAEQVDKWMTEGEESALIAECIFEMDTDNY